MSSVFGYLLLTLARLLGFLIDLYTLLVGLAVLMSWVRPDPYNPLVRFLYQTTEPAFRFVRRLFLRNRLPQGGLDWSPILLFLLLIAIDTFLVGLLRDFAGRLLVD